MTREDWLHQAINKMRPMFRERGGIIPDNIRVSIGFPGGSRPNARKTIGQYWPAGAASDGVPQIFVSPVLNDPIRCLDVLTHELVHACTPGDGHGKQFGKLARALGLEGKLTATVAGTWLNSQLQALYVELGEFPHGSLDWNQRKKQGTRLNKVSCSDCGYTVRVTARWLEIGAPLCPCNSEPMQVE